MKVRLPDTRYDDEIGRLCKTINQMAEDLAARAAEKQFISSVSHELRTPLTSIKGWVETISNIDDPSNETWRGLAVIGTETDRNYTMVEELLDFSRMQNGIKMNCRVHWTCGRGHRCGIYIKARIRQEGCSLSIRSRPSPTRSGPT